MLSSQQQWLFSDTVICFGWLTAILINFDDFIYNTYNFVCRGCLWSLVSQAAFKAIIIRQCSWNSFSRLVITLVSVYVVDAVMQFVLGLPLADYHWASIIAACHSIILGPAIWKVAEVDRTKEPISRAALMAPVVTTVISFIWPLLFNVLDWNNQWKIYPRASFFYSMITHLVVAGTLVAFTKVPQEQKHHDD
eukprot:Blabericola_migrator_1__6242@NODE_314_length_10020_cov_127_741485_g257_i0_p8_GENE_NODE_314_length_10020_cov_127_741485_g257_i0NODE_314_length_10020_cov_127_741485_g257_i0_p8_ORF_typecomplete_len193_score21_24PIGF/PF06699_11/0_00072DUF3413/PF11893_8/0_047DUF3792/PF12670_7/4_1DUF3792/PF12670_7/12ECFribofla_trS/PF07155_12/32ECFribofla_trS/PF07155_12/2_7_NODE_314_length_10020_cov_127_741485_g257_i013071885